MGPQAKLPGIRTTSKRQLASNKDWEECVCPQHEELHQENFKVNWKEEGDTSTDLRVDEALHKIRGMNQTDQKGNNHHHDQNIQRQAINHTTSGVCIQMPGVWETNKKNWKF